MPSEPTDSTSRAMPGQPAAEPMLRLFGDLGSWSVGQPLAAGTGEVVVQLSLDALEQLVVTLGVDGVRALRAVLRNATPVSESGAVRLELPGYSGAWLREHLGLSERAAYRASAALQDAGLLVTTSLPGARGAAGTQRAVLSKLVGVPGGAADVRPTRRGRRSGLAVSSKPPNRHAGSGVDGSAVSTKSQKGDTNAQVSAVSTEPQNRLSTGLSSSALEGRKSSPTSDGQRAAPAACEVSALADAPTLWALQRALAQVEHRRPGALFGALRPVIADQSSAAGQLAKALRIRSDGAPAVQISEWLLDVLTAHPAEVDTTLGGAGSVFAQLRAAGVVVPRKVPPETALVRIAVAAAAGLDTQVGDWRRWLASACRRPATDWSQTRTLQRLRVVLNAAWREELASDDPPPAPAPAGDDVDVGQHDAAPPLCAADVGGPTSEQIAELLPAALAVPSWYSTLGYDKVANSPHLARAAVAAYLAAQSTG